MERTDIRIMVDVHVIRGRLTTFLISRFPPSTFELDVVSSTFFMQVLGGNSFMEVDALIRMKND